MTLFIGRSSNCRCCYVLCMHGLYNLCVLPSSAPGSRAVQYSRYPSPRFASAGTDVEAPTAPPGAELGRIPQHGLSWHNKSRCRPPSASFARPCREQTAATRRRVNNSRIAAGLGGRQRAALGHGERRFRPARPRLDAATRTRANTRDRPSSSVRTRGGDAGTRPAHADSRSDSGGGRTDPGQAREQRGESGRPAPGIAPWRDPPPARPSRGSVPLRLPGPAPGPHRLTWPRLCPRLHSAGR